MMVPTSPHPKGCGSMVLQRVLTPERDLVPVFFNRFELRIGIYKVISG